LNHQVGIAKSDAQRRFPALANVPPLSSGRIRKARGCR
jgi:hypothetical protein